MIEMHKKVRINRFIQPQKEFENPNFGERNLEIGIYVKRFEVLFCKKRIRNVLSSEEKEIKLILLIT